MVKGILHNELELIINLQLKI